MESSGRCCRRHEPSSLPLKLLVLNNKVFSKKIGELFKGLVWLRWFDFDNACLPSYLSLGNLRVLELYQVQRIETLWKNNWNPPLQLRELIIQMSFDHDNGLQSLPKSIGSLKHLKKLVIHCRHRSSVSSLPDHFCELESLKHLELEGFEMLLSLPSRFGNLRKLRHVSLKRFTSLSCLPVSFKRLTCLQYLDLSDCSSLNFTSENLDILESITKLEHFDFRWCKELEVLPNFTNQPFLRKLCIDHCRNLRSLPTSFGNLSNLIKLDIDGCGNLRSLPTSFGNLCNLTRLDIDGCSSLECLPSSFGNLSSLTTLHIKYCQRLESFPDSLGRLNRLEYLYMFKLGVKPLPDTFQQLANLRELSIDDCPLRGLTFSNSIDDCPLRGWTFRWGSASSLCSLKKISLLNTQVETISISEDCCSLETLDIMCDWKLMEIETLPRTLKQLRVVDCPGLEKLPSFAYFTSLKDLGISGPNQIEKIEILEQMTSLETLRVKDGWKLLPRLAGLEQIQTRLRRMELSSSDNISAFEPYIQTIQRWPCEMVIWGRAVDSAESIVADYTFPHLTVVHSVANIDISDDDEWTLNCPKRCSSNAAIICVLFNCLYEQGWLVVHITREDRWPALELSKGKWIWICVFDSSNIEEFSVTIRNLGSASNIHGNRGGLKIEKGMIAVGEEIRVQAVLKELMYDIVNRPT